LARQTGNDGDDPLMGGAIGAAQIQLSGSNADGTLGGLFRLRNTDIVRTINSWENQTEFSNWKGPWYHRVFAWWKPIPQVRIWLGIDQDGMFDTSSIVGWGFHAGDNDYIFNHHWDFWREIFPGNWDGFGLALSFYPIPGLDLNLVFPTGTVGYPQAYRDGVVRNYPISGDGGMLPDRLVFNGGYSLDFGRIQFTYQGKGYVSEKGLSEYGSLGTDNNGRIGLSFLVTAIEGIQILAGGSVVLVDPDMLISAGVGVVWNGDGFGVKFRAGMQMQGDADMFITANVMPFFSVGEKGQVLVDIGITNDGNKDPGLGWSVIPAYRLGIEGGAFKIGLQVYNNVKDGGNQRISGADYVKWNVPMLLAFNF
jgi:hypothetical protein